MLLSICFVKGFLHQFLWHALFNTTKHMLEMIADALQEQLKALNTSEFIKEFYKFLEFEKDMALTHVPGFCSNYYVGS